MYSEFRHFFMHNDFIQERKDFIITIHTITPWGKQYKDSAYICSRNKRLILNNNQVKLLR